MSAPLDFTFCAACDIRDRIEAMDAVLDDRHFRLVESNLDAIGQRPRAVPAVLVFPMADAPRENRAGRAGTVQPVSSRIGVIHVVPAANAPHGKGAEAPTGTAVKFTRGILLGWTPEGGNEPLQLAAGRLTGIEQGRVYWLDEYTTPWVLDVPRPTS